ncbi:MAG: CSLREA domain-containing protein, partial [Candidatus Methylomirabilis sp.]|nr:CSLREA domain-containing protein [Deltaproteobacteria bacterium]
CSALGDLIVTKTEDTADGACDADCSLREAILATNAAAGTDRILVPAGHYRLAIPPSPLSPSAANGDLDVFDDLWIEGDGVDVTILDGDGVDRVLALSAQTAAGLGTYRWNALAVRGLTVRGGRPAGGGAGIFNGDARLTLERVAIRDNIALGDNLGPFGWGGGLFNSGLASIRDAEITGNASPLAPGSSVLWAKGGGVANVYYYGGGARLVIRESLIEGNEADGLGGGGLFDDALAATSVLDSAVRFNHDGGVYSDGGLLLRRTSVTANSSDAGAGVVVFGPPRIDGIPGSGAVVVDASTIADNEAAGIAGGLAVANANFGDPNDEVVVTNTTISGNRCGVDATYGSGADVYVQARSSGLESRLSLSNVTIMQSAANPPDATSVSVSGLDGRPAVLEAANTIVAGSCEIRGTASVVSLGRNLETGET